MSHEELFERFDMEFQCMGLHMATETFDALSEEQQKEWHKKLQHCRRWRELEIELMWILTDSCTTDKASQLKTHVDFLNDFLNRTGFDVTVYDGFYQERTERFLRRNKVITHTTTCEDIWAPIK